MSEPVPSGYLAIPIYLPELSKIMATIEEVQANFTSYQQEVSQKLDAIDDVMEGMSAQINNLTEQVSAGQVDQATVDQLAADLASARSQLAAVSTSDPSGDNPPET